MRCARNVERPELSVLKKYSHHTVRSVETYRDHPFANRPAMGILSWPLKRGDAITDRRPTED
jgi:hypothetical protein